MRRRSPRSFAREAAAAQRRQERDSLKQRRELVRQAKEQAKLSALEQARFEVETYANAVEVLLSVHREPIEAFDWIGDATTLPPHLPQRKRHLELRAAQNAAMAALGIQRFTAESNVTSAAAAADREFELERTAYDLETGEVETDRRLANRVLKRDPEAYREALADWDPFENAPDLNARASFTVVSDDLIECSLTVRGTGIIPLETKTLTTTGKVSSKAMPKRLFNEIYEDYVCGCVLRIARELFAYLPISTALVTALVADVDPTGAAGVQPVLSAVFPRAGLSNVNWHLVDASDTVAFFQHRGDVKASKRTGDFESVEPLTPDDIRGTSGDISRLSGALSVAREQLAKVTAELEPLTAEAGAP